MERSSGDLLLTSEKMPLMALDIPSIWLKQPCDYGGLR